MSEAKVSLPDIFKTDACSQCARQFPPSPVSFDARHAVPCGHVLCGDCVHRVEAEQKSGPSFCRRPGCGKELASANEFWAAWCTARSGSMFETQRNVQERSRPTCTECERDPVTGKQHLATHRCETCGDGAYFCTEISSVHPRLKASRGHIMVALDPPRALCAQHQLPFEVVEASSQRPMCAACVKAAGPDVAVQTFDKAIAALDTVEASANQATLATFTRGLAEPTFTAPQLYAYVTRWGVQEATRIRAWEEREVKSVQVAANETLQLVQAVCTRKLVEGASLIMQRVGLRASLEELDRVLTDLPSEPLSRLKRKRAVYVERAKLCKLLASEKIAVPSAQGILRWAQLPSLSGYFGEKRADSESAPAIRVSSAAASILSEARMRAFGSGPGPVAPSEGKDHSLGPHAHHGVARANPLKGVPARSARRLRTPVRFHTARVLICLTVVRRSLLWSNLFIPANPPTLHFQIPLEPAAPRSLRSISMSHKPSAFVGLDSKTIVVGFRDAAPLQVWDLADGKLVRELDGVVKACQSMVNLPDQRVAVGCRDGLRFVVTVFDVSTGRKIQELAELGGDIHGLAFVENRLLTVCGDKTLRAWSQDNEGMFTKWDTFETTGTPFGSITGLSSCSFGLTDRVAISTYDPAHVEVWDWETGELVETLDGFGGACILAHAQLPDGRLVAGDDKGVIQIGYPENWEAAEAIDNGSAVVGVLANRDGSFVTTDKAGKVRLWRDDACEACYALAGVSIGAYFGTALAAVGRRIILLNTASLLVIE